MSDLYNQEQMVAYTELAAGLRGLAELEGAGDDWLTFALMFVGTELVTEHPEVAAAILAKIVNSIPPDRVL